MATASNYVERTFSGKSAVNRRDMLPPPYRTGLTKLTATYQDLYALLEAYYLNTALYDEVRMAVEAKGGAKERLWALRNPASRIVEFYASKLWPGMLPAALPIATENPEVIGPIRQIWRWSNWTNKKQLAARYVSMYGDLFIKVFQTGNDDDGDGDGEVEPSERRIHFQVIRPQYVTDMDLDERGYVTFIRLDVPTSRRIPRTGKVEYLTHTEVWSKERGDYRLWEHTEGAGIDLERLGRPTSTAELAEFGIDFVPFVYAAFRDIGEDRGVGAYGLTLDKIDELNAMATRLHRIMFRYGRPIWAILSNMVDATRSAMPAPRIEGNTIDAFQRTPISSVNDVAELEGETVLYFPGQSEPKLLIPDIRYDHYLDAIVAQQRELEDDQPELTYLRVIREFKETSGRALLYTLSPAIDRVMEVRGSVESALVRANQMGLTLGQAAGLWRGIGTFDSADPKNNFDHTFLTRDVIPQSEYDRADTMARRNEALERAKNLGIPQRRIEIEMGYNDIQIAENERWRQEEQEKRLEQEIDAVKEKQDAGVIPGQQTTTSGSSSQTRGAQQPNSRNITAPEGRAGQQRTTAR